MQGPFSPAANDGDHSATAPAADLLQGVRVLDLTNVLSGPFCTYQLALLGAEVIKIEHPQQGDLARQLGAEPELNKHLMGTSFIAQNAGKKSVTLNLKSAEGQELFKRLVETADVVVENFRPGVMQRLGLDYTALAAVRPSLIYCAISGFGQDGPLKNKPAYDQIVQGMAGVMSVTGDSTSAPLRVGFPVSDTIGGLTAAFAVVAALCARHATGRGRMIDVSMLDSTIVTLGWVVSNYLMAGVVPRPLGNENMTAAPSGTFSTQQGLLNIAANKQEHFERLAEIIGRSDLVTDERFAERENRKRNRRALNAEINAALASDSAAAWESKLTSAGIPAGQVLSVPEILDHPQIKHRRLVQDLGPTTEDGRSARVVRAGYRFADCEPSARGTPPTLGEHTRAIFGALGIEPSTLADLHAKGIL